MTLFAFPSITGWPTIDDFVCPSPRRLFLAVFAPLAFGAMAGLPTHSRRPTTRRSRSPPTTAGGCESAIRQQDSQPPEAETKTIFWERSPDPSIRGADAPLTSSLPLGPPTSASTLMTAMIFVSSPTFLCV